MSYVVFCKGKTADKPYWIEDLKLYLYSMEELCYYIYSNALLCDGELLKPKLALWIRDECGLPDLYASIDVVLHKDPRAERVAGQIFAYMDYLSRQERESVCEKIKKSAALGINERRKSRGDLLYLGEKYGEAIGIYQDLLSKEAFDDEKMQHSLLYNVGCCYGNMFYYDIAYDWFMKAASMDIDRGGDLTAALFCKHMVLSEREWERFLAEHEEFLAFAAPVENQCAKLLEKWEKEPLAKELAGFEKRTGGREKEYYVRLKELMEEWKRGVHEYF